MAIASWISDLIGGGAAKIIDSVGTTAKQFITTEGDRQAFELELKRAALEVKKLEMDAEARRLDDVASARDMYKSDNKIQKVLAILFTTCFFGFMVFLLFLLKASDLTTGQENLIFTMFGAISGIMVTIIGFYFGSSKGSHDKNDSISQALQRKE